MGILSSKSTEAVRASVVHAAFNVLGTLIWLPLIWLPVDLAIWISSSSQELEGTARAASEVPRQIANANTLFNVINTLLFIGVTGWFAKMAERLVPERAPTAGVIVKPSFLDDAALNAPSLALQQVRLVPGRVAMMLKDTGPAMEDPDMERLEDIARCDEEVDIVEAEILEYMGRIRTGILTEEESNEFQGLMMATNNLESVADVIETDVVSLARKVVDIKSASGEETRRLLAEFYDSVVEAVEYAVQAIGSKDQHTAQSVVMMKDTIRDQSERLLSRKAERLTTDDPDYLDLVRLEMAFVDQMRRIHPCQSASPRSFYPRCWRNGIEPWRGGDPRSPFEPSWSPGSPRQPSLTSPMTTDGFPRERCGASFFTPADFIANKPNITGRLISFSSIECSTTAAGNDSNPGIVLKMPVATNVDRTLFKRVLVADQKGPCDI